MEGVVGVPALLGHSWQPVARLLFICLADASGQVSVALGPGLGSVYNNSSSDNNNNNCG